MTKSTLNLDIIDDILMQAVHNKLEYPGYAYLATKRGRRVLSCETYCEAYVMIARELDRKQRGL